MARPETFNSADDANDALLAAIEALGVDDATTIGHAADAHPEIAVILSTLTPCDRCGTFHPLADLSMIGIDDAAPTWAMQFDGQICHGCHAALSARMLT